MKAQQGRVVDFSFQLSIFQLFPSLPAVVRQASSLLWIVLLWVFLMGDAPARAVMQPHDPDVWLTIGLTGSDNPTSLSGFAEESPPSTCPASDGLLVGPNLYAYVRQNPWTGWDPHGLAVEWHHRYAKEFEAKFRQAGIDVHAQENGMFLTQSRHSELHSKSRGNYNGKWREFFAGDTWKKAANAGPESMRYACEQFRNQIESSAKQYYKGAFHTEVSYREWDAHSGNAEWKNKVVKGSYQWTKLRMMHYHGNFDDDAPSAKSNSALQDSGSKFRGRTKGVLNALLVGLYVKNNGLAAGLKEWALDSTPGVGDIKGIVEDYSEYRMRRDVQAMDQMLEPERQAEFQRQLQENTSNINTDAPSQRLP